MFYSSLQRRCRFLNSCKLHEQDQGEEKHKGNFSSNKSRQIKGEPVFSFHSHLRETPWIPLVFIQILGMWQKLGTIHKKAFSLSFEL